MSKLRAVSAEHQQALDRRAADSRLKEIAAMAALWWLFGMPSGWADAPFSQTYPPPYPTPFPAPNQGAPVYPSPYAAPGPANTFPAMPYGSPNAATSGAQQKSQSSQKNSRQSHKKHSHKGETPDDGASSDSSDSVQSEAEREARTQVHVDASDVSVGTLRSVRSGGDIPCRSWRLADRPPYAAVLCLHGFGMSMNSYDKFGQKMAELGVPVYAIDLRGFGCWQDAKGYRQLDLDDAVKDVQTALKAIRTAHPDVPLALVGESMGGSVALQAIAGDQTLADGLICSVPAGDRFGEKAADVKVAMNMLTGHKHMAMGKDIVKQITKDPSLRKELENDPRGRMTFTAKELIKFQKFMNRTNEEARKITSAPVLILQGGSDRLVKPKGTAQVYVDLATKDKDLVLIGTSEHLILEEGQFDEHVIDIVTSWIWRHVIIAKYPRGRFTSDGTGLPEADFRIASGHFHVGQGLLDLNDEKGARPHLLKAITIGRGSPIALISAQLLGGLAKQALPSESASGPGKFVTYDQAMRGDKPTIIFFGAFWIDPSYELNAVLERAVKRYGHRVDFVRVDADKPENAKIVNGYGIEIVPTVLFLNAKNEIVASEIGSLSDETLAASLPKLFFSNLANGPIDLPFSAPSLSAPASSSEKPTVVYFGSGKVPACAIVESEIQRAVYPNRRRVDVVKIDADDPKNAPLVKQYGNNQLPVVLFLNSSQDVVSYTTGLATQGQINDALSKVVFTKRMPLEASAQ